MHHLGSGTWYRSDKRETTEEHQSLDIRQLHRKGLLKPGCVITSTWWRGERKTGAINVVMVSRRLAMLRYRYRSGGEWQDVNELVPMEWTPCSYGGERSWFRCPGVVNGRHCDRRVAVLYGGGRYFLCRHCYRLVYECQREAPHARALRRAQKIRLRLGGSASMIVPFPPKPKRMRWRTYERLREAHDEAEQESWISLKAWLDQMDQRMGRLQRQR